MKFVQNLKAVAGRGASNVRLAFTYKDKNAGIVVAEGALWACVLQLTNPFYQLFVRQMGGDDLAISLVNALPALFALITLLPMAAYIDTVPRKKTLVSKMILLYACTIPFFVLSGFLGQAGVWVFIVAIALFNIPLLGYTVGWQSFFSDIFTERQRVMPYASREKMRNIVQAFCMLLGGVILSYLCTTPQQKILTYQVLFACAFGFAIFQWKVLLKTDDSHAKPVILPRKSIFATYKMCFTELKKNKKFSMFLLILLFFYISWQMAWPLFFIYVVEVKGTNEFLKLLLDISGVVMFALMSNFWGKYIQKKGPRKASVISLFVMAISPGMLILWNSYLGIFVNFALGGVVSPAFNIGMFNDMLSQLSDENKTFNIGIYNTVTQLSAFVAPLIGVAIYRATSIEFTMYLSTALRFIGAGFFLIRFLYYRKRSPEIIATE